jgi:hypothetical protein
LPVFTDFTRSVNRYNDHRFRRLVHHHSEQARFAAGGRWGLIAHNAAVFRHNLARHRHGTWPGDLFVVPVTSQTAKADLILAEWKEAP